jgi:LPS O-antigen subunit length determinant protein (WzzB/FepE family)
MWFDPDIVARAAAKCLKYHEDRLRFYIAEYTKSEKELRKKGIDMAEVEAFIGSGSILTASYTGGYKATSYVQPKFDQRIVNRINECNQKINRHRELAAEFTKYERAFSVELADSVELDADDINFFRLWDTKKKDK